MKNYFYSKFSSIISAKLIVDQETGRSKGYAFFEFSNYKEFNQAMNIKEPLIFGKQKLVLNSAKNKYDNIEEETINDFWSRLNIEERPSLDSLNLSPISSTETNNSSISNSKESNNSLGNSQLILADKIKNGNNGDNMDKNFNDELQSEIKYALKKLSEKYYYKCNNNQTLLNYYCSPFIHSLNKGDENYIPNKLVENIIDNN